MLMLGNDERSVALESMAVLAISMLCMTIYSCATASQRAASRVRRDGLGYGFLYRPVSRRLALLSGMTIVFLAALPAVEAVALEQRLRRLTRNVPLDPESIDGITQTVHEAAKYKIKLRAGSLNTVVSALRETSKAKPTLSAEALNAGSAAASAATINLDLPAMHGKAFDSLPEAKGSTWEFAAIATNTGPDNYSTVGVARKPDIATMERIGNPLPASDYGPAFLVVKGLTATLDGYCLKQIVFQDMHLIYHGGPLLLENVYFFRCDFRLDESDEAWRLLSALTASVNGGGWISFSSPPQ